MDYEKAYKEALERAKEIHKFSNDITEIKRMEQIFPELKESEDEKIRKAIIAHIKGLKYYDSYYGVSPEEMLAWLEKQADKDKLIKELGKYKVKYTQEVLSQQLEKQGEQMKTPEESLGIDSATYNKIVDEVIYGGQIPVDKAVPKFKVGDTMRTLQEANDGYTDGMPVVVSIDNEYYHCTNELIAIKDQDDYEFPPINMQQKHNDKPKWNEEDDGMVACIKIHLKQCLNNYAYTSYRKWLESLKQRIGK